MASTSAPSRRATFTRRASWLAAPALIVGALLGPSAPHAVAVAPWPATSGTPIVVDGDRGDWEAADRFALMYRAAKPSKPVESYLSLRYDCGSGVLSVMVETVPGVELDRAGDQFVKIDGRKRAGSPDVGAFALSPDGRGWEASLPLATGSYDLDVHAQVLDGGSQTSAVAGRSIELSLACPTGQAETDGDRIPGPSPDPSASPAPTPEPQVQPTPESQAQPSPSTEPAPSASTPDPAGDAAPSLGAGPSPEASIKPEPSSEPAPSDGPLLRTDAAPIPSPDPSQPALDPSPEPAPPTEPIPVDPELAAEPDFGGDPDPHDEDLEIGICGCDIDPSPDPLGSQVLGIVFEPAPTPPPSDTAPADPGRSDDPPAVLGAVAALGLGIVILSLATSRRRRTRSA